MNYLAAIPHLFENLDLEELKINSFNKDSKVQHKRNLTYLISYPVFIAHFSKKSTLTYDDLIICGNMAYAWMPTVLVWKSHNFTQALEILNKVKHSSTFNLSIDQLTVIKSLVNGSVVGMSKVLHFINPEWYPIWDSRINETIHSGESKELTTKGYIDYATHLNKIKGTQLIDQIRSTMEDILGYKVTKLRAIEMVLFYSKINFSQVTLKTSKALHIPKYKRDGFIFISNLGKITANEAYDLTFKRDGYLISEHYLTSTIMKLAKVVKSRRNLLISDNGNFTRIKAIAKKYEKKGLNLYRQAEKETIDTGEISQATIDERKDLINEIGLASEDKIKGVDITEITSKQLSVDPEYMIGMEDLTIPALMLSNLMHPIFRPKASEVIGYQKKTNQLYTKQYEGEWGSLKAMENVANFLVIHAYDYDSAYQGSNLSEEWHKDGVAISYGGPMLSNRWITEVKLGSELFKLDETLPEKYLIAQALTLGIINGNNKRDMPYHILGVGTPILILLIGYQLRHSSCVSIDSTAPFQDSNDGKIYGQKNAFLKMDLYRLAASHLIEGTEYTSNSPFFKDFEKKYPSNWTALRNEMGITTDMNIRKLAKELEENNMDLIDKYLPFFSKMRGGKDPMIALLRMSRAGHNYWILQNICKKTIRLKSDPEKHKNWVEKEIEKYCKIASPKWAKAVKMTYQLTEQFRI